MGQFDWEETLDLLVRDAQTTNTFKGGIRKTPTLEEVVNRLREKWEDELRYGDFFDFTLLLYSPDDHPVPGRSELVRCHNIDEAREIAENILPPLDLSSEIGYEWRVKE